MDKRPIRIEGNAAYIPLTKGYEAVIDAADVHLVDAWNWTAKVRFRKDGAVLAVYAARNEKTKTVMLHRQIMDAAGANIDHIDGDGLNCRRENMRPANVSQNGCNQRVRIDNTSGAKGVTWHNRDQKWQAQIVKGGVHAHLGYFKCRTAAAVAYAKASRQMHGEFGRVA